MASTARGPGPAALRRWWLRHGLGPLLVRWWRRLGLRARVTLIATLGLLVALIVGDLLLLNTLRVSLTRSVDASAKSGASEVAALINADHLPVPVPVAAGITIQVLNSAGRVSDVSPDADWMVPLVSPARARALANHDGTMLVHGAPFDMPSLLRVAVVKADGGHLVIAAVPFSEASGSLNVVARGLVIGTPVLFLVFAGAIWAVTGLTLRPIGALRKGAAKVTATGQVSDLPVPEARDEVRLLAVTLNDMLSRLAAAQQRQRALVSDTAHELRSPIASIRTQLEVALDFPAGQDWETTARDVHADVLRLARLAEDLLLLARLDEQAGHEAPPRGTAVDLIALCRSAACRYADTRVPVRCASAAGVAAADGGTNVRGSAADGTEVPGSAASGTHVPGSADGGTEVPGSADGGVAVTGAGNGAANAPGTPSAPSARANLPGTGDAVADLPDAPAARADVPVLVTGDWERLDRLLVNLVDNAVRYAKSAVTISVRRDGGWAELSVTDDGPGIAAADLERAFDRFARLDDARSREGEEAGGAGLGLAIVRATAQACGGTAHLQAASPPPGLRAVVRLPVRAAAARAATAWMPVAGPAAARAGNGTADTGTAEAAETWKADAWKAGDGKAEAGKIEAGKAENGEAG